MYLKVPAFTTRYSTTPLTDAALFFERTTFDWSRKVGTIDLALYADADSAYGGKEPIERWAVTIPAQPVGDLLSLPNLMTRNQAVIDQLMGVLVNVILTDSRLAGSTLVP